ncbi:hypothetical protein IFM89_022671 [Coptis chinensis]|uniref:Uncharacterized protein n=1 Tax=Coptis chinensis TaxID=261450 RepID=A0A835GZD0_9MAGN|nr:hypothetical protein IFM89_022671 [Coptis chinensis]
MKEEKENNVVKEKQDEDLEEEEEEELFRVKKRQRSVCNVDGEEPLFSPKVSSKKKLRGSKGLAKCTDESEKSDTENDLAGYKTNDEKVVKRDQELVEKVEQTEDEKSDLGRGRRSTRFKNSFKEPTPSGGVTRKKPTTVSTPVTRKFFESCPGLSWKPQLQTMLASDIMYISNGFYFRRNISQKGS